jgi:hypothetical protein
MEDLPKVCDMPIEVFGLFACTRESLCGWNELHAAGVPVTASSNLSAPDGTSRQEELLTSSLRLLVERDPGRSNLCSMSILWNGGVQLWVEEA